MRWFPDVDVALWSIPTTEADVPVPTFGADIVKFRMILLVIVAKGRSFWIPMILDDVAVAVLLIEFVVVPPIILLLTVAAWPDAVFNLIPQKLMTL